MKNFLKNLFKRKAIAFSLLAIVILGGYFGCKNFTQKEDKIRYATAAVEKGTLVVSVSGSGQVSVLDQADIKPKAGGEISYVGVKIGQEVKAGALLAKIDPKDAEKAVQEAETALETANLELEKLLSPPKDLTLFQAENAFAKAEESQRRAEEGIKNGLEDSFNSVTNIFFDLPTIISAARDILYSYDIGKSESTLSDYDWNLSVYENSFKAADRATVEPFIREAESDYAAAREKYDQNLKDYKRTDYSSDSETIETLLNETADTMRSLTQAIKSEINLLDFVADYYSNNNRPLFAKISAYRTNLQSYYSKTNSYLQNLYSLQNSLKDDRQALIDAGISAKEKKLSLDDLKAGADELEIRSKRLSLQQKEEALSTARENLAGCSIYSPFDGVIAEVSAKSGDTVSFGATIASIITKQKIVEISLNEIDAASVKPGQKAILTFDALSDVSLSGKVVEADVLGTVSQGVVSYGVKISLDTQDEMVKSGMSVTADIITDVKQDILVLPNSAIKSQGGISYVEFVEAPEEMKAQLTANIAGIVLQSAPKQQLVETGISNDTSVEIVSGLNEGDIVVTQSLSTSAQKTSTQTRTQTDSFQMPGMTGQVRISR